MPTTTYTDPTFSVSAMGSRTDADGVAVSDISAEELRFDNLILSEGWLGAAEGFQVRAQVSPNMTVRVGSGVARQDHYVVVGGIVGQGNYIVRLDEATKNVTIAASDPSLARVDAIYLVISDNAYDATARTLPRIGYRKGDPGGGAPGADGTWSSYAPLATIAVAAGATTIVGANITDTRLSAGTLPRLSGEDIGTPRTLVLDADVDAPTTTLVQVLTMGIQPGQYLVEAFIHYAADPTGDMSIAWGYPSGSSGRWTSGGVHTTTTNGRIGVVDYGMVPLANYLTVTGDAGGPDVEVFAGPVLHLTTTVVGGITLSIGKGSASAFPATVRAGSSIRVTRLA